MHYEAKSLKYRVLAALSLILCLLLSLPGHAAEERHLMRLGPGDSVSIEVYGQPDMTTTVYVADNGTVSMPLAGAVQIAGLSPVEAAAKMEKALKDGGYFVDPHVNVTITQSKSQRVTVLGEVRQPARYPIEPNTSIFELIAQAGGVSDNGADVGYVTRRDADGNSTRYPVDLKDVPGKKLQTLALEGGDELYVPRLEQLYIYGEVTAPGAYRLEPGMTVIQAIARAGGITVRGSERRVEIKRTAKDGKFVVTKAKPNDVIQPNDVIHVKESIF